MGSPSFTLWLKQWGAGGVGSGYARRSWAWRFFSCRNPEYSWLSPMKSTLTKIHLLCVSLSHKYQSHVCLSKVIFLLC